MKQRVLKHAASELIALGWSAIANDQQTDPDFRARCVVVIRVLEGTPSKDLTKYYNISVRSINDWVAKADRYGFEALRNRPRPGKPKKLPEYVQVELRQVFSRPASEADPEFLRWTGRTVQKYLLKYHRLDTSLATCYRYMEQLGCERRKYGEKYGEKYGGQSSTVHYPE